VDPHTSEHLDDAMAFLFRGAFPSLRLLPPLLISEPPCNSPPLVHDRDVLELHVHGGRAIINAVLSARSDTYQHVALPLRANSGVARTRAVEGLRDLVDADTESQQRAALCVAGVGTPRPLLVPRIHD
jgi:hypothetical protein